MPFLARTSYLINCWVERSLAALGLTMALVVIVQVFCRYVLNASLFWSEELARYLLVWLCFLGSSSAYHRQAHPTVNVLVERLSPGWTRMAGVIVHIASLWLFVIMIWYGSAFAYFVRNQISPALGLPKWLIFAIIPLSGLVFAIHGVNFLIQEIKGAAHDR